MWSCFGDNTLGPPGSYYYYASKQINYFWNIFDKVLIRPDLLEFFVNDDLKILTEAGSIQLLTPSGIPNIGIASDHLPIIFSLDVLKGV